MNKVKALRKRLGIKSQQEFADKLGVDKSHVGKWEIGKRTPDLKSVIKICSIFGISSDDFLGLEKPAEAPAVAEGSTAFAQHKKMPELATLGQRLRYFREEILGATYGEFVKKTPARIVDIADYELDEHVPDARFLTAIHSKYHEVLEEPLLEWLLDGKAAPRPRTEFVMKEVMFEVERELKRLKLPMQPKKKTELVMRIYDEVASGELGTKDIRKAIKGALRKAS